MTARVLACALESDPTGASAFAAAKGLTPKEAQVEWRRWVEALVANAPR
jgi:hypothetical protein